MPFNYNFVNELDFSLGVDEFSSENAVAEGFVSTALNVDIKEKRLQKRKGYRGHSGGIPMRVESLTYRNVDALPANSTLDTIELRLNNSLDLIKVRDVPIIVYGRTSLAGGPFSSTNTGYFFQNIDTDPRKTLTGGSITLNDHGFVTTNFFSGVCESTAELTYDNLWVEMDEVRIDKTTFDLTLDYTHTPSNRVFSYYLLSDTLAGTSYIHTFTGTSASISAGTHNLDNFNIIYDCFQDDGTEWKRVVPDNFQLNSITGQVDVTFTASGSYKLILRAVPSLNYKETTALGDTTLELLSNDNPFIFHTCYYQTGANTWDACVPDSVVYDDTNNKHVFTFASIYASSTIKVFWEAGSVQTNVIRLSYPLSASGEDATPQLTIWGIGHDISSIYGQYKVAREGWVTHLDSYKSQGENYVVAGLGGNFYASRERDLVGTSYLLPSLLTNLRNRVSGDQHIGPAFYHSTDTPTRTRGYIKSSTVVSGWAPVTDVSWNSGTGWVDYTLSLPSHSITGTPISTTTDLWDRVTIQQTGYKKTAGTFRVMAVDTSDPNTIILSVLNSSVDSSDYDETDVGGLAGIFTDQILWDSTNYFLPSDTLICDNFPTDAIVSVVTVTTSRSVVDGIDQPITLPLGLRVTGTRTSHVVPLRDRLDTAMVDYFLATDMVQYAPNVREMRVQSLTHEEYAVDIDGNGTTATVTINGGGTTRGLDVGYWINLTAAGQYSGEHQIIEVTDLYNFVIETSESGIHSGTLQGYTISVDESLQWSDLSDNSTTVTVNSRWIPVEAPDTGLVPTYKTYYWDSSNYALQDFVRSCMVSDNMYLTNGSDEVLKYDGTNLYRAGFPRWQAGIFATIETSTGIVLPTPVSKNVSNITGSFFNMAAGDEEYFQVGDKIQHSGDGNTYTITNIDTTNHDIKVDKVITSATHGTISVVNTATYRYYFRLNAVDANGNVVASAAVGHENFRVELAQTSAIHLKLVGFPNWDLYDYDRIEVAIYRTKANTQAPFYRISNIPLSYAANTGYIEYKDTASDDVLSELDAVNTALLGAELGSGWENPLRAKYCTSLGNRLVLGNITDYPKLDITLDGASISDSTLNGSIFQFERVETSPAPTTTDMVNCQRYELTTTSYTVGSYSYTGSDLTINMSAPLPSQPLVGDWVYLFHATAGVNNSITGWHQVTTAVSTSQFKITHAGLSLTGSQPLALAVATDPTDIPVFLGTDYNYNYKLGNGRLSHTKAMLRLSNAINSVNRVCRTASFNPWLIANGDDTYGIGRAVITQPKVGDDVPYFRAPSISGVNIYVGGNLVPAAPYNYIDAKVSVYPSRVLISYENYPEMFDSPTEVLQQNSDSVIDINSADGQQITGMIPFFGDSTFGARQKNNVLVVFKENSIYVVDLDQKAQGLPAVQRLETHGIGCRAPYSIAYSKYGIMFASYGGIYSLRRDLSIQYLGKYIERKWLESVNRDQLDIMQGHHYADGKMYKLSVPMTSETEPSQVLVYHHTNEDQQQQLGVPGIQQGRGGWTYYDNHVAIGWANLRSDAFFANTQGQVKVIRNTGLQSDFRDDSEAIQSTITTRAIDFGIGGIRKVVDSIITHHRTNVQINGSALNYAIDLEREFHSTDKFKIQQVTALDGLSSPINRSIVSIKSDVGRRKGIYFQFQWVNATYDEPLELAGFTIKVAGLTDSGITQAADT